MRRGCLCIALVVLATRAVGVLGTPDPAPAATLLLPYFEVDLDSVSGMTTTFSINNISPAAAIAHVTLWTNAGIATGAFDVPLTGFDVSTFNVRDFFTDGAIDPGLSVSKATLRAAHFGEPDPETLQCSGIPYGDNVVRGYILVDNVNQEDAGFPTEPGYFAAGGTGRASNDNVLWGDYFYIDFANNFAQGELLVHIEAGSDPLVTTNGNYTFYGRYVGGTAVDNREPLPAAWSGGYDLRDNAGTQVIYWRDTKASGLPFACGAGPLIFPLEIADMVAFDDAENAADLNSSIPLVEACGRVDLAATALAFDLGWLFMNLNVNTPGLFGTSSQAFVTVLQNSEGRFSTTVTATALE